MYFNYVEWFVLRWMICTNLKILYLQRWVFFDYVERFALLLNDLVIWRVQWNFLLENILPKIVSEFTFPRKSKQWALPLEETPLVETPPVIIALKQMKNRLKCL